MVVVISVDNNKPTVIVGGTTKLTVTNASKINNLTAVGSDDTIGTIALASGVITITGVKAGTFNITLNGDNAVSPLVVPVTVTTPITITVDNTNPAVNVGANTTIKITNFASITNPAIKVADTSIATAQLSNTFAAGDVVITGVKSGSTTMDITGDNATKLTVNITVNEVKTPLSSIITNTTLGELADNQENTIKTAVLDKNTNAKDGDFTIGSITNTSATLTGAGKYNGTVDVTFAVKPPKIDIKLSKNSSTVTIGAKDTITITNVGDLTNPKVVSNTPATATATLSAGTITITGVASGTTTATVSADNGNNATINITVNKVDIKTVLTKTTLGELADNKDATIATAVVSANSGLKTSDFTVGTITTTTAVITASASSIYTGTQNVSFTIAPPPKVDITVDNKTPSVVVNATTNVKVTNADNITNLKATVKDNTIATATLTTGTIAIKGVKVGSTTVDITGDNANTLTITVNVTAIQLNSILKVTALGELADNQSATIKAATITANAATKLTADMFDVTGTPTETQATCSGKGNYSGDVNVTYTIKAATPDKFADKKKGK